MSSVDVGFQLEDDEMKTARLEVTETEEGVVMGFFIDDGNVLAVNLTTLDAAELVSMLSRRVRWQNAWRQEYKP